MIYRDLAVMVLCLGKSFYCYYRLCVTHLFYLFRNHGSGETGPESQKCVIFLHDKPLACGSDWNIKTARRHAATKASQRLLDEPNLLESVCNCRVSLIKRGLLIEEEEEEEE